MLARMLGISSLEWYRSWRPMLTLWFAQDEHDLACIQSVMMIIRLKEWFDWSQSTKHTENSKPYKTSLWLKAYARQFGRKTPLLDTSSTLRPKSWFPRIWCVFYHFKCNLKTFLFLEVILWFCQTLRASHRNTELQDHRLSCIVQLYGPIFISWQKESYQRYIYFMLQAIN